MRVASAAAIELGPAVSAIEITAIKRQAPLAGQSGGAIARRFVAFAKYISIQILAAARLRWNSLCSIDKPLELMHLEGMGSPVTAEEADDSCRTLGCRQALALAVPNASKP
jgi:hypothetical protein